MIAAKSQECRRLLNNKTTIPPFSLVPVPPPSVYPPLSPTVVLHYLSVYHPIEQRSANRVKLPQVNSTPRLHLSLRTHTHIQPVNLSTHFTPTLQILFSPYTNRTKLAHGYFLFLRTHTYSYTYTFNLLAYLTFYSLNTIYQTHLTSYSHTKTHILYYNFTHLFSSFHKHHDAITLLPTSKLPTSFLPPILLLH
uniref:Uncharacterized protein n=1 Tax=Octopus bimaculoides TaxID=37653 RepID=A0A0L8GBX0_OCTBM